MTENIVDYNSNKLILCLNNLHPITSVRSSQWKACVSLCKKKLRGGGIFIIFFLQMPNFYCTVYIFI